ncbi:Lrp/AsnC family transcriptional regulator [Motiliproteus sp. MSK22-1]|uniref:siroheme decarboxylase subunit beta n=1 Tax=Motiliproteus sp. MSK22-1 TaxID=1897630 RepID=UPI0009786856|nr:AsnC family transcriptional regulator [Motiliproteus sp. MSK22-1]OMH36250.1 protein nirH [Motiliproteus sp. MSK22-1]
MSSSEKTACSLDALDRQLIEETQQGLPLTAKPYQTIAERLNCDEKEVISRLERMMEQGVVRRIGVVPNHYKLGYRYNLMTVWDVPDEKVTSLGESVGALDFVSHSYERPRHLPLWHYNLFAMVHGRSESEVEQKVSVIQEMLGSHCRDFRLLNSKRILKKTGLRLKKSN